MPSKKNKLESRFKPKEKLAEKLAEKVTEKVTEKVPVLEIPQVEETLIDTIVEETPVCETPQTIDDLIKAGKTIPIRSDQIICNGELLTINVKELVNFFKSLACGKVRYGRSPHGAAVHLGLILGISKDEAKTFMANFKTK